MRIHFAFYRCTQTKTICDLFDAMNQRSLNLWGFWGKAVAIEARVSLTEFGSLVSYDPLLGGITDHCHSRCIKML